METIKEYYDNGKLRRVGQVNDNFKEGEWKFYHENGQLKEKGEYIHNLPCKEHYFYNEQGELHLIKVYPYDGYKSGYGMEIDQINVLFENNKMIFLENGEITGIFEGNINKRGEKQGEIITKYSEPSCDYNTTKYISNYKDNKLDGVEKGYDSKEQLTEVRRYKDGKLNGKSEFYVDKKLVCVDVYENDNLLYVISKERTGKWDYFLTKNMEYTPSLILLAKKNLSQIIANEAKNEKKQLVIPKKNKVNEGNER